MSPPRPHQLRARLFGLFFLVAFASYGVGNGLVESITGSQDVLSSSHASPTRIIVGVILMALVHTAANLSLSTLMLPVLKQHNSSVAYLYLGAAITATVVLVVGALFLLLLIPLGAAQVGSDASSKALFDGASVILTRGNYFAYQIGMAIWGLGGLMLCSLLYQSKLVPRALSIWGFVGYVVFVAGTVLELFGHSVGLLLSAPGGLFEISLSLWLIFNGFSSSQVKQ